MMSVSLAWDGGDAILPIIKNFFVCREEEQQDRLMERMRGCLLETGGGGEEPGRQDFGHLYQDA